MQTLRTGCSTAEPKNFAPPQTPFPGAQDGQNLISWRWSLPLPTNQVWSGSMHAISCYRGNRPTNKQTHRQDRLQYTVPQLQHSVNNAVTDKMTMMTALEQRPLSTTTQLGRYQNIYILDYIGANSGGGGSDNWSYKTCKAPVN